MSILTIAEANSIVGNKIPDEDDVRKLIAGLSVALERACNRRIAKRVSTLTTTDTTATLEIPFHQIKTGATVHVFDGMSTDIEGYWPVASVTRDTITLTIDSGAASGAVASSITVRPVVQEVRPSRGSDAAVLLTHLPIGGIKTVSINDGANGWTELLSTQYLLTSVNDGVSFSGCLRGNFPIGRDGGRIWDGVQVAYISGEPEPPSDLIMAMKGMIKASGKRLRASGFASERYDYFSYTKLSAAEIGKLFGDADRIIRDNKIAVI